MWLPVWGTGNKYRTGDSTIISMASEKKKFTGSPKQQQITNAKGSFKNIFDDNFNGVRKKKVYWITKTTANHKCKGLI